jgi:hypothetical protein
METASKMSTFYGAVEDEDGVVGLPSNFLPVG